METTTLGERLKEFISSWRDFSSNIKLTGLPRQLFLRSEWDSTISSIVTSPYLIYRFLFLSYFLVFLIFSLTTTAALGYWPILATNWSFSVQTLYALLSFLNVARFWWQERVSKAQSFYYLNVNSFESFIWLLFNLSCSVPQYISITFWLFVYPSSDADESEIGGSLTVHGINALLAILDAVIVAVPLRVTHVLYPLLSNSVYILFTYIYEVAGGTYKNPQRPYIYPVLNWRQAPVTGIITLFAGSAAIIVFHYLFWVLTTVRTHFGTSYRSRRSQVLTSTSNKKMFGERSPLLQKTSPETLP